MRRTQPPDTGVELVVQPVRTTALRVAEEPAADAHALAVWAVELDGGQIVVGGQAVHPVIARDLWLRLGALLGQAERDGEQAEWTRLSHELDRQFRGAPPARGRTLGKPSMVVEGLVLREREDLVAFRVATFSLAMLKPTKRGWEGPTFALRPATVGHELRPLGYRVRLPIDAVAAFRPLALPGPVTPARPRQAASAPERPQVPAGMEARWAAIRAELAAILALAPEVGDIVTLELIAGATSIARDVLRGHLETLVEQGEIAVVKPAGEVPAWKRLDRPAFGARRGGRPGTRLGKAPKTKAPPKVKEPKALKPAKAPKEAKAPREKSAPPPPPTPSRVFRCTSCDRTVEVPASTVIPAGGLRCRVCHGAMAPRVFRCEPCDRNIEVPLATLIPVDGLRCRLCQGVLVMRSPSR